MRANMDTPDHWIEQAAWLRGLARKLVRDAQLAEDAVQQTLLTGLRNGAGDDPSSKSPGWWARVLRNVVRQDLRGAGRRAQREHLVSADAKREPGEFAAPDEALERLETQSKVLAALRSLDEPYRSTMVLKFLEERSPREIAKRTGVPLKTVQTRLSRGLEHLRRKLDADFEGGRQGWLSALLPIARLGPTWIPVSLGALTLMTPLKLSAAAAAVACALWIAVGRGSEPALETSAAVAAAPESAPEHRVEPETPAAPTNAGAVIGRQVTPISEPTSAKEKAAPAEAAEVLEGWVKDLQGEGRAGLEVVFEASSQTQPGHLREAPAQIYTETIVTGPGGFFETTMPTERGRFVVKNKDWATVWTPVLQGTRPESELILRISPALTFGGAVLDPNGVPIPGASVVIRLPEKLNLGDAPPRPFFARIGKDSITDEFGQFQFDQVGWIPGLELHVMAKGYQGWEEELPSHSRPDQTVVLKPTDVQGVLIAGRVLDAAGQPFQQAHLGVGDISTQADASGRFRLEIEPEGVEGSLMAVTAGQLPQRVDLSQLTEYERANLDIRIDRPAVSVSGRVVNEQGEPVAGATVKLVGEQVFGMVPMDLEGMDFYIQSSVENLIEKGARTTESDDNGRFEITGLCEREYTLVAGHRESLELAPEVLALGGSENIKLVLSRDESTVAVAGRVVDSKGQPRVGAEVRLMRLTPQGEEFNGPRLTVDERGEFQFTRVHLEGTRLCVHAEDSPRTEELELDQVTDTEDIEVVLPLQAILDVRLADPTMASEIRVLNAEGDALLLEFSLLDADVGSYRAELVDGASGQLRVDESATTLVLLKKEDERFNWTEVSRTPIRLQPGEVTVLRP